MDTAPEPIQPIRKYNRLAILSFALGLLTMSFPAISILYLVMAHGGPGYVQSLFCGIPLAFASIIIGSAALVQIRRKNQSGTGKGAWMAILGIVLGIFVYGISVVMLAEFILPFLLGNAN
jgi:hypothetical protein